MSLRCVLEPQTVLFIFTGAYLPSSVLFGTTRGLKNNNKKNNLQHTSVNAAQRQCVSVYAAADAYSDFTHVLFVMYAC